MIKRRQGHRVQSAEDVRPGDRLIVGASRTNAGYWPLVRHHAVVVGTHEDHVEVVHASSAKTGVRRSCYNPRALEASKARVVPLEETGSPYTPEQVLARAEDCIGPYAFSHIRDANCESLVDHILGVSGTGSQRQVVLQTLLATALAIPSVAASHALADAAHVAQPKSSVSVDAPPSHAPRELGRWDPE